VSNRLPTSLGARLHRKPNANEFREEIYLLKEKVRRLEGTCNQLLTENHELAGVEQTVTRVMLDMLSGFVPPRELERMREHVFHVRENVLRHARAQAHVAPETFHPEIAPSNFKPGNAFIAPNLSALQAQRSQLAAIQAQPAQLYNTEPRKTMIANLPGGTVDTGSEPNETTETEEKEGEAPMSNAMQTPIGTLSFPHLFTPRPPAAGAEPRFSIALIFDEEAQKSPQMKALKAEIVACAKEEFGENVDLKTLHLPFRKGEEKEYAGYDDGTVFISPWSKQRPGLVDARLQEIIDPNDVFPGQKARATVRPFPYSNSGNKGVSLGLNNVQITDANQPRLDGRVAATNDFDAVDAPESEEGGAEEDDLF